MPALTVNKDVPRKEGVFEAYRVAGGVHIFKGALVCINAAGWLVPAAQAAGLSLVGIALDEVRTFTAAGVAMAHGALSCRVACGMRVRVALSGVTQAMVGRMMYIVNDQTVSNAVGAHGVKAGILTDFESATSGWIDLMVSGGQGAILAAATATAGTVGFGTAAERDHLINLVNELRTIVNTFVK